MDVIQGRNCDLCAIQHLKTTADIWCPNCEEALCSKCQVQHGISKSSKAHKTLSIENYEMLPPFVQEIRQECEEHKEKYEYFCSRHDTACCLKCLKSFHHGCHDTLTLLNEMTDGFKSSKIFNDLESNLKNVLSNLQSLFSFEENCLKSLHWQRQMCGRKISTKRKEINTILNEAEQNLREELSNAYDENREKIEQKINQLKSREKKMRENLDILERVKSHATEYQAYFCVENLLKETQSECEFVQSLVDSANKIQHVDLDVKINEELDIDTVSSFGKIQVNTVLTELEFLRQKPEAQMSSRITEDQIDQICLQRKYHFDLCLETYYPKNHVQCCTSTKEGNLIFLVPTKSYLLVYSQDGKQVRYIVMKYPGTAIDVLKNNVVVAFGTINEVHLLDLTSSEVVMKIPCEWVPGSLHVVENNNIVIGMTGYGFKIFDQSQIHVSPCIPANLVGPHYLVVVDDRVFYTDWTHDSIVSTDIKGKSGIQQCTSLLKSPMGITSDGMGGLFVSGFNSNNVVIIARNGACREVISAAEGIEKPRCLHFIRNDKLLVIANEDGKVYVYEVIS